MEKWLIRSTKTSLADLGKNQVEKILYRIISNRGIETEEELEDFLNPSLSKLNPAETIKDMLKACDILIDSLGSSKIRIIGDYDVDGIMSTYILYDFIKKLNEDTDYRIPHRIKDGYGVNISLVEEAIKDQVDLIITCDNGISAFEPIELGVENNIKFIVLDHHEPKVDLENNIDFLPKADAVVDPKRRDCPYPFKGLCGGAIAYKFVELVGSLLGFEDGEIVRDYLEFAAIATVCDVMELVGENRIIVANGLKLLNNTTNLGLKTLIKESNLEDKTLDPYHLGFIIGPLFNASGRLDSADIGLSLLLEKDIKKAKYLADNLRELNIQRTKLTKEALDLYLQDIDFNKYYKNNVIVSYMEGVHESIAGIIAGRVKERYNRPTIILTDGENGAKGSARSIDEFDIIKAIGGQKELLNTFGGHKGAAGLSLDIDKIDEFRRQINASSGLTEEDFLRKVYIDLGLPTSYIDENLIESLEIMGPYGNKNPRPLFGAKDVYLGNLKLLGKNKNVLKMTIREDSHLVDGIMFSNLEEFIKELDKINKPLPNLLVTGGEIKADIVYQGTINEWNGNKNIQIIVSNFRIKEGM